MAVARVVLYSVNLNLYHLEALYKYVNKAVRVCGGPARGASDEESRLIDSQRFAKDGATSAT